MYLIIYLCRITVISCECEKNSVIVDNQEGIHVGNINRFAKPWGVKMIYPIAARNSGKHFNHPSLCEVRVSKLS